METNTKGSSGIKMPRLFSSAVLKYLAAFFMLIDHVAVVMLQVVNAAKNTGAHGNTESLIAIYRIMRHIGRFSFPVFCFFIVEGYCKTKSRAKYLIKLIVFGSISQIPFEKALFNEATLSNGYYTNVFFTLALGLMSIWFIDAFLFGKYVEIPQRIKNWPVAVRGVIVAASVGALCYISDYFHTDYRYGGIIMIIVFFLLWDIPEAACGAAYAAICSYNSAEVWSLPAIIMLMMYNGNRGRQSKYFFYVFYPLHLTLLWIIKEMLIKS